MCFVSYLCTRGLCFWLPGFELSVVKHVHFFQSLDTQVPRVGLSRHLDVDGLTKFNDPVQKQIESIKTKYEQEISKLKDSVSYLENLLAQHASACNGDICNLEFTGKLGNVSIVSPINLTLVYGL